MPQFIAIKGIMAILVGLIFSSYCKVLNGVIKVKGSSVHEMFALIDTVISSHFNINITHFIEKCEISDKPDD